MRPRSSLDAPPAARRRSSCAASHTASHAASHAASHGGSRVAFSAALCVALCAASLACERTQPPQEPLQPKTPPIVRRPDTPARLKLPAVELRLDAMPQLPVTMSAQAAEGGLLYLSSEPLTLSQPHSALLRVSVEGLDPGLAPVVTLTAEAPPRLVARLRAQAAPTSPWRVRLWLRQGWDDGPGSQVHELPLLVSVDAKPDDQARARFYQAARAQLERVSSAHPFYTYAAARRGALSAPTEPARASQLGQLMELYTGATSIKEALQYDRALRLVGQAQPRQIPVASLPRINAPAHPWPAMIQALGRKPVMEPLAQAVPADMIYVHFHDLRELVKLAADLDEWISPAARFIERAASDADFMRRYERQLIIERTSLSQTLGHVAAKGVALTSSDPFLREGSDVSILFHVGNRAMLTSALDAFVVKARANHADLTESSYAIDGVGVRLLKTPDRRLERHQLELGDALILTNSRAAAERFVQVHKRARRALAQSDDFVYMRAVYPYDPKAESGFAFLGDELVARVVSPEVKIAQARRMAAQADLQSVAYASLLFGWMEGRRPQDLDELMRLGYLQPQELLHEDGQIIAYDPARGPASQAWGRLDGLTPLLEVPVDMVTPQEREAYERFAQTYQSYWRGFIDPIALRVGRSADGKRLTLEGRMLPLIEDSDYRQLERLVGRQVMRPGAPVGGLEWTFAIGQDAGLRRELDRATRMFGRRDLSVGWLGDFITVGVRDRSAALDAAIAASLQAYERDQLRLQLREQGMDEASLLGSIPVYALVDVRNPVALAGVLTALRSMVEDAAPGMVSWAQSEPYREQPVVSVVEQLSATRRQARQPLALHYTTVQGKLLLALQREVLEEQIDALLDGRAASLVPVESQPVGDLPALDQDHAQSAITLRPWDQDSPLALAALVALRVALAQQAQAQLHQHELLWRGLGRQLPQDPQARRELALGHLGAPLAADSGQAALIMDEARAGSRHPTFADLLTPRLPALDDPALASSPLGRLVGSLHTLHMTLSFDGGGAHRGLHTRLLWTRR